MPGFVRHGHLPSIDVVLVAVDDRPRDWSSSGQRLAKTPYALWVERLPVRTDEKRRDGALDGGHAAGGLSVARRDAVPDAPDVLPALPTFAVEEGVLQIVGLIAIPAA